MYIYSKVKHLDTELHIATTTLKSLELSESKVRFVLEMCCFEAEEISDVQFSADSATYLSGIISHAGRTDKSETCLAHEVVSAAVKNIFIL